MSAPYSLDLRERVLAAARDDGLRPGVIAARFRVANSTVRNWLRRARETGSVAVRPHGGGMPPKVDAAGAPVLEALVEERDERTLAELAAAYRERTGTALSLHAVARACSAGRPAARPAAGEKRSLAAAEQARPDVAAAREAWREAAPSLRPDDLVFVDESGVATNMARVYGRAKGGRRARGAVPAGHWRRLTVLGGLSPAGLVACMTVDAAADTDVLVAFTRHVLVPALRPGQTVVLDNLSAHARA